MTLPVDYEPAVRDPRKLRRTAWVLVAIMLAGGVLVFMAYEKWSRQQAMDDRPAVIHRILKERDLRLVRQDGKTADLFELRGQVWVVNVMSLKTPQSSQRSLAVMKRLAEKFSATPDFNLVSLAVEPMPAADIVSTLAQAAETHAMKLPQWWLGGNQPATLHTFIKNELKADVFPHAAGGEWIFDSSIVLIDRNGHLRRAVVPRTSGQAATITFNFDLAAKWDAQGLKSGSPRSNEAEMETLLAKTIDKLLAEPLQAP